MIHVMPKECIIKLSPDFRFLEFDCPCKDIQCRETKVSQDLIDKLQKLRDFTKFPLTITSGHRCAFHQKELRDKGYETAAGPSSHESGLAADIVCGAFDGRLLAELAERSGFENIGVGKRMIHVDVRPNGPRRWVYTKV